MFTLRLLGGVNLVGPSGPLSGPAAQQRRLALLAVLAAYGDKGCSRDKLVGYFWPEREEQHARHLLANSLYALRGALGQTAVLSSAESVRLNPDVVSADVTAFQSALERGELEEAADLYTGPFLDGFYLSDAPEFDRWVESERQQLARRYAEALEALAERAETAGRFVRAAAWWQRLAAHDPINTRVAARWMLALEKAGDPGNALQVAEQHRRRLSDELGVEPDADFRALVKRLRNHELREGEPVGRAAPAAPIRDVDGVVGEPATDRIDSSATEVDHRERSNRRWLSWALAVAAPVAFIAGLTIWYFGRGREAPANAGIMRVAVFPFSVPPDAEYADLDVGLMELLGAALDGAGELREVDPYAVLSQLQRSGTVSAVDIETARRIALELGASHFVFGRLLNLSGTVRISASLYSLASDSTWRSNHAGELEGLLGLVDAQARDILVHLEPVRGEFRGSVSGVPTTTYTALRAYLRGQALMRRHHTDSARVEYRTAVREDSMFALAWMRLAEALEWGPPDSGALTAWQHALRLRSRLSPRQRAFLALGYASGRGNGPAAERAARAMVTAYPNAVEGWRYLGDILRWYPWQLGRNTAQEAETAYRRALALDPDNQLAVNGLALVAYHEGRKARGDSLWERWTGGGHWVPPEDSLGRARYFARLESLGVASLVNRTWATCFATDSLADAARIAALLTDPARPDSEQAVGHHLAAYVAVAAGQWQGAEVHFRQANRLEPGMGVLERAWYSTLPFFQLDSTTLRAIRDSVRLWTPPAAYGAHGGPYFVEWRLPHWLLPQAKPYVLGLLSARLGDADAAARYTAQLEGAEEPRDSIGLLHDLALEVRALAEAERGAWEAVLTLLADAELEGEAPYSLDSPFKRRTLGRFLRGEALMHLGHDQEALGWFSTMGWLFGESPLIGPAQLRRGEIYERLGNSAEAVRHYRRFVARWRDADPEYQPLVDDVKSRIVRLARGRRVE
jgi:DNA-binding SARP family transcriptional activator/Tfp pilus assembly protein PilF